MTLLLTGTERKNLLEPRERAGTQKGLPSSLGVSASSLLCGHLSKIAITASLVERPENPHGVS